MGNYTLSIYLPMKKNDITFNTNTKQLESVLRVIGLSFCYYLLIVNEYFCDHIILSNITIMNTYNYAKQSLVILNDVINTKQILFFSV